MKRLINIPRKRDYKLNYLRSQKLFIEQNFEFLKCRIENNVLICKGWVQPPFCKDAYHILVEYVVGREPKSTILYPEIKPNRKIHMYYDHSLCLHYSKDMKWTEFTRVYQHTIPWISEWIVYYELYQVNGNIWLGRESPDHLTEATMNVNRDIEA